jgi:hypothetical protein
MWFRWLIIGRVSVGRHACVEQGAGKHQRSRTMEAPLAKRTDVAFAKGAVPSIIANQLGGILTWAVVKLRRAYASDQALGACMIHPMHSLCGSSAPRPVGSLCHFLPFPAHGWLSSVGGHTNVFLTRSFAFNRPGSWPEEWQGRLILLSSLVHLLDTAFALV